MSALAQALKQSPLHHPGICYTEDIMNLVPQDVQTALSQAKTHDDEQKILAGCSIQKQVFCAAHQRHCPRTTELLNFSGPCCNDHSTAGTCTGREGASSKFLLIHLKRCREDEVPLILLENVTTGEFSLLVCGPQLLSETYAIWEEVLFLIKKNYHTRNITKGDVLRIACVFFVPFECFQGRRTWQTSIIFRDCVLVQLTLESMQ